MGGKSSNNFQSDRPESGGADKDMQREKSGLLERDKEKFAIEEQARREASRRDHEVHRAPFSVDQAPSADPDER